MNKKDNEGRIKLKTLWMLLFGEPKSLSDEQIARLLESEKEIRDIVRRVFRQFPEAYRRIQIYRAKKGELSQLPTGELMTRRQKIFNERASVFEREDNDSFFKLPSIDSDEFILREILKERGA